MRLSWFDDVKKYWNMSRKWLPEVFFTCIANQSSETDEFRGRKVTCVTPRIKKLSCHINHQDWMLACMHIIIGKKYLPIFLFLSIPFEGGAKMKNPTKANYYVGLHLFHLKDHPYLYHLLWLNKNEVVFNSISSYIRND